MTVPALPAAQWGTPLGVGKGFADCVAIEAVCASSLLRVSHWQCRFDSHPLRQERYYPWYVLVVPRSGASVLHSRGRTKLLDPGCAVLHEPFSVYASSHPFGCGDRGWNIAIRRDALCGADPADPSCRVGTIPVQAYLRWRLALERQAREPETGPLALEEATMRLVEELGEPLAPFESEGRSRSGTAEAHETCFERARAELFQRFREPLQLADLARVAHASPFHLCRIFKRASGLSVHRYQTRLRLLEGLDALVERDVPLSELALDLGFSSHSHFTDAFRRELGMSPSGFRRLATAERVVRARQARRALHASL